MSVDLDFDSNNDEPDNVFEDDFENEGFDDTGDEEPKKRNPLRVILLILLVLVLLCVLCYLGSRFVPLSLPFLGGGAAPEQPPAAPAQEETATPFPLPTAEGAVDGAVAPDAGQPDGAAPGEAETTEGELPGGEAGEVEGAAPGEAVEGEALPPAANEQPAPEAPAEATAEQPAAEATAETGIIITTPVAGPTATPGGEAAVTASCDANTPPTANAGGPYTAMMGKGQAIVNFDGSNSTDQDGQIESYDWDFGDGSEPGSGVKVQHGYSMTGTYTLILTVTDNCGAEADAATDVTITAAAPPITGTPVVTPATTPAPSSGDTGGQDSSGFVLPPINPAWGTAGFCYTVQRGDTLWGIATAFGVDLPDLAFVNGVSPDYYVIAGQGLFVPVGPINPYGPNIYPVQPGDTLYSVAVQCSLTTADLAYANGLYPDSPLSPGQLLRIPPPWSY